MDGPSVSAPPADGPASSVDFPQAVANALPEFFWSPASRVPHRKVRPVAGARAQLCRPPRAGARVSTSVALHSATPTCVQQLGLRDVPVRMGVPDVEVLVKHKYREDLAHAPVKVREILRHGGHPFRLANRKMSRCLSLIWKFAESLPSSVEVVSMGNLKSFVHKLRGEGAAPG
eukprot:CAMPEP_0174332508 /NCGR_PEP_ID=MMETSP0810-20121108/18361_1 /TAXON_ID=73025 ORGANISM="Eutreptiella gymnastica-like, Strain CCMP1594" /NCGR_SAMPLE_ID=MMETSP0810 /ASSEMBLY_ACC=CAM_ASM_000659 /LENGTH=173 /DNA_ID=CAMNT_0015448973 /DNA_START=309 /DNA_END=827 /DNA_ORIENTATION=-